MYQTYASKILGTYWLKFDQVHEIQKGGLKEREMLKYGFQSSFPEASGSIT